MTEYGATQDTKTHGERRFLLVTLLREPIREIMENPVLLRIERGELNHEEWQAFAVQRYLAARRFEDVLEAGIKTADAMGDTELAHTLRSNLNDERGVNNVTGERDPAMAHEKWRQDFYAALGVDAGHLRSAQASLGTSMYQQALEKLIEGADPLIIAGALLALEVTIPGEFKKILVGCEKSFPERFKLQDSDSASERDRKEAARLYLADHIRHDAEHHYVDLSRALEKYTTDENALNRIQRGISTMQNAKHDFYSACNI